MMHSWKAALDAARIGESKYKILVQAVTGEIERGVLVHDQRLPPQRQVADALGISVQTTPTRSWSVKGWCAARSAVAVSSADA